MAEREAVFPEGRQDIYLLFVSGQAGSREDGGPEPNLEEQVRPAFRNLLTVLYSGSCAFDDVVDRTVFLVGPETMLFRIFKVRDEFWGCPPHPNLTAVGVTWLYGFSCEIKVTARIRETSQ